MQVNFEKSVTILYSRDVTRSIAYYTEKLGFDQSWEWDTPATFGGISKGTVEVFFCKENQGNPGTWLCIILDDVDAYYNAIREKGAKIVAAPESKEWSMREMLVEDPDGHIIRFGHRIDCD
jgi:catechol 2,3-dioxygenase-like lactoylglutathione lyase family enzyme